MVAAHPELLWVVVTSGIVCAVMAMAIGANDVANAFSTSVGSGSLKLRTAVSIAFVFEIVGALFLGGSVTDSIRSKVLNFDAFQDAPEDLAMGMMCASAGTTVWLVISTWLGMPVSTTHSIIGALAGFGVASGRMHSIRWMQMFYIVLSWIIVPMIAVVVSCATYILLQEVILKRKDSFIIMWYSAWFLLTITSMPLVIFVSYENFFMRTNVTEGGLFNYQQWFKGSSGNKAIVVLVVLIFVVSILATFAYICAHGRIKRGWSFLDNQNNEHAQLQKKRKSFSHKEAIRISQSMELKVGSNNLEVTDISNSIVSSKSGLELLLQSAVENDDEPQIPVENIKQTNYHKTEVIFSAMQIIGAVTVVISHSANDTANAVAPFATVMLIYLYGITDNVVSTPWYILLGGGLCMSIGLSLFGYKVIKTVGLKLARVTPSKGYTIDTTAGSLVLILSHIGVPLSSTHCTVSSILGVGLVENLKSQELNEEVAVIELKVPSNSWWGKSPIFKRITTNSVNLKLYRKIFLTWITTMLFSGIISAIIFVVMVFCRKIVTGGYNSANV
ncbi:putative phosphate transporter [Babesia divergens]|uniref:Phosphate transporter n=1 Tax=Babesia divergens TaxID=32595 RepID=A0AAD9GJC3_BABDI|nr:putative phosphate transporter [Babesia divergens]